MRNEFSRWYVASIMAPEQDTFNHVYMGWHPCIEWCKEQFGDKAIDGWRFQGEGVFEFREQADYLLFTLTWGK